MEKGDRVSYTYEHHLNSKSVTVITKFGTYLGDVRHDFRYWHNRRNEQMARVQFDKNKTVSRVPLSKLKAETGE